MSLVVGKVLKLHAVLVATRPIEPNGGRPNLLQSGLFADRWACIFVQGRKVHRDCDHPAAISLHHRQIAKVLASCSERSVSAVPSLDRRSAQAHPFTVLHVQEITKTTMRNAPCCFFLTNLIAFC
jgi:hypothetical protein